MRLRFGTFFVAAMAASCAAWAAGNGRPEETVECPVSANMRGHENTEWSIYYGFHLTDANRGLPRVLLVGDSICNGYQRGVAQILEGKMNVSYWVSSYCVTSPGYLKRLALCLDEAKYDVVHFNNGLHSLGTPTDDWAKGLEAALKLIRARQPSARIIWTTSTPLKDAKRTAKARELNAAAADVVKREADREGPRAQRGGGGCRETARRHRDRRPLRASRPARPRAELERHLPP